MDDPTKLLRFDPAAVAIRGSQDVETLDKLNSFAADLTRYLALLQPQQVPDEAGNNNVATVQGQQRQAAIVLVVAQQLERETVVERVPTSPLVERQADQQEFAQLRRNSHDGASSSEEDYHKVQAVLDPPKKRRRAIVNGQSSEDDDNNRQQKRRHSGNSSKEQHDEEIRIGPAPVVQSKYTYSTEDEGDRKEKSHRAGYSSDTEDVEEEEEIRQLAVVKREPSDEEDADDQEQKMPRYQALCRHYSIEDDEDSDDDTVAFPFKGARQPRILAYGYSGKLSESELQRSVGRTRRDLNLHISALGLFAKFGMTLVSKRNDAVSHLTFSQKWNDLPETNGENLELWLGEGAGRLALTRPLNPLMCHQPAGGIPIFWACKSRKKGGDTCHYVGHFRSINFVESEVVLKGKNRQALFEFKFVKFCQKMASRIAKIPPVS
jgi:hypothetical protein